MSQTYFPFSSGAGADVTEEKWQAMAKHWLGTGVLRGIYNELLVYADSTGLQIKVQSGAAWIQGHYFQSDAEEVLSVGIADVSNPRMDRVVVRVDWIAKTIQLAVLQGTPAASPVAPNLTQNSSRWEIELAQVTVDANAVTIASTKINDTRTHIGTVTPFLSAEITEVTVSSANVLTQIPITTSNIIDSEFITVTSNSIKPLENGLYYIDVQYNYSGVNSDQTAEILVRRYIDSTVYGDFGTVYRGASGQGGNNGGVPIRYSSMIPVTSASKIQLFTRTSEAPRIVKNVSIRMWKIG